MEQVSRNEYNKIHDWLRDTFGSAVACENPKCEKNSTKFEYAIKAGKTHKKLRSNYMTLCVPCHRKYDTEHKNTGHQKGISSTRLSMKLLWKLLHEFRDTDEFDTSLNFVEFVEKHTRVSKRVPLTSPPTT